MEENQHLLPPSERTIPPLAQEEELNVEKVRERIEKRRKELEEDVDVEESELESDLEEEVPKMKSKKLRMKVGGGVEAMDIDD